MTASDHLGMSIYATGGGGSGSGGGGGGVMLLFKLSGP